MITLLAENKLELADLREIPVKRPERAGNRWQGVQHHELARTVRDQLLGQGIGILSQQFGVDKLQQTMVAGFNLEFPDALGITPIDGQTYSLVVQNNNTMKHALTFAVGTVVMVCENGVVTGDFVVKRKHTTGLDLPDVVSKGIEQFVEQARQVEATINQLKDQRLTTRKSDHLLMEAGRARLLPWSLIGQVEQEYQKPTHVEFSEHTGWGLLNAWNHVAKKINPIRQLHSISGFRKMLSIGNSATLN